MSKLFNFSNLLTENTFNLVKSVKEKNYLSEALSILTEMDKNIQNTTKQLYSSLLEAESKKEENSKFGEFYTEYKTELLRYKNKMKELAGQFCVNLETYVDANIDVLDKCCCVSDADFQGVEYSKLLDDDTPNIDPYKAFKKEWAFIGRLLQDLDPSSSDEEKTKIIATVYNSLSKEINDGWLDKCVQKIADSDECSRDNFAKVIYDKFVTNSAMQYRLDTPTVEQCKLSLKNYTNYTACISKSADEFCCGIDRIACEVGSMLFRNMDKKLIVNTDVEGVANATYRLSDYSMNQINLFLTTKLSQIRELTNLYTVALSIKMDCIFNYFKQCVAMINIACDEGCVDDENPDIPCDNTSNRNCDSDECPELPEDRTEASNDEEEEPEDIEHDEPVSTDAGEDSQDSINGETEDLDDDSQEDEEEPETSDSAEVIEPDQPQEESYISEIEKSLYLFEADMFFINRYNDYKSMNNTYLREADEKNNSENHADTPTQDPKTANNATTTNESIGDKVKSLVTKIKDTIQKLKDSYDKTYSSQIKMVSDNKKIIMGAAIPEKWTIQKYNISLLSSLTIVPFDMKDAEALKDANKYLDARYSKYVANGNSIGDRITKKMFDEKEQKYGDAERNDGYDYVVNQYKKYIESFNAQVSKLGEFYNKEEAEHDKQKNTPEKSTEESTILQYFSEASENDVDPRWEAVNNYFMINYKILVTAINIYIKNFKKQYAFLNKLYNVNKNK